ncbi:type III-B CRISPR module RAMP protein Cmr4 [Rhodoflexus caldus]|uniref:type III-B CRISPR module RAMP protein Cmr4 n=1 Tax=Rhodoflexus caldus TaxID=2891236 RepID=UPI00202A72BF|nr:type III-B CRISPR module RAMP protein Cmr4 [Rhodoflexus caldus]
MYKNAKPLFLICETPLHVGSGSDLGIVDLPIQRERHTNFPKIEASSLKGALREAFESELVLSEKDDDKAKNNLIKINKAFGFDDGELGIDVKKRFSAKDHLKEAFKDNSQFSGALALTDARLLLFPVKSLYGVFAWITCPRVIKKFISDLGLTDLQFDFKEINGAMVANGSALFGQGQKMQLEEFVFSKVNPVTSDNEVNKLGIWLSKTLFNDDQSYWSEKIKTDIVVLDDNDFRDFVTLATEVITRTKINNETGTVQQSALFSEEYLPAESVMYSLVMFSDEFSDKEGKMTASQVEEFFGQLPSIVQIGGNATLGKGIVRTKFVNT